MAETDSLTLQRAAALWLCAAMRAFRRSCSLFCLFGQRSRQISTVCKHKYKVVFHCYLWIIPLNMRNDCMLAGPNLISLQIFINTSLLVLFFWGGFFSKYINHTSVAVCVLAVGLILLSASVLLHVNAGAQSIRNRIPPVCKHSLTHTHTGCTDLRRHTQVSQLLQDKWCANHRAERGMREKIETSRSWETLFEEGYKVNPVYFWCTILSCKGLIASSCVMVSMISFT